MKEIHRFTSYYRRFSFPAKTLLALAFSVVLSGALQEACEGQSFRPRIKKIHSRAANPPGNNFGEAVAISDRFFLIGEQNEDTTDAASIFNARTGRFLRQITAEDGADGDRFGGAVAVQGHVGVIGAAEAQGIGGVPSVGGAYVFDLRNGRQLLKLSPSDGSSSDQFGVSVAIHGDLILVGANAHQNFEGAAYLFDRNSGAQLAKFVASDATNFGNLGISVALSGRRAFVGSTADGAEPASGAVYVFDTENPAGTVTEISKLFPADGESGDFFGFSVSVSGNWLAVGAPFSQGAGVDSGSAYVFDWTTGAQVKKLSHVDAGPNRRFGESVAIDGKAALVGANNSGPGGEAVYYFDLTVPGAVIEELQALNPPDGAVSGGFGEEIALCGNRALIGASTDDELGNSAGAAYFIEPLSQILPLTSVAKARDYAPGIVDADFRNFSSAVVNGEGEVVLLAGLSGPGSNGGRDSGAWATLGSLRNLGLAIKSRQDLSPIFGVGDVTATRVRDVIANGADDVLIDAQITRVNGLVPGIERLRSLISWDGTSLSEVFTEGQSAFLGTPGLEVQKILESVQSDDPIIYSCYRLRRNRGQVPPTAVDDSGLVVLDTSGNVIDGTYREGVVIPGAAFGGDTLGQILGRVSISRGTFVGSMVFPAFRTPSGGGRPVQQMLRAAPLVDAIDLATQGNAISLAPGSPIFSTFLGETVGPAEEAVFRARLRGPGVNAGNNEGLWHELNGLIARKGEAPFAASPTQVFSRFLGFWKTSAGIAVWAKLRGQGVTARNDCGLFLYRMGSWYEVLREGDYASDCDGVMIRTIQRIDVDAASGNFVVLGALTGSPKMNQACFSGTLAAPATPSLSSPGMILRKGRLYTPKVGQSARIRSLAFDSTLDRGGAGAKGNGQVVGEDGHLVLTAMFDNRALEVLTGLPW